MPFDGHMAQLGSNVFSLYIQQDHYREHKNIDPLIKGMENGNNKHINLKN